MKRVIILISGLLLLSACSQSSMTSPKNPSKTASQIDTSVLDLNALKSLQSITPQLAKHRVVFIGEQHTEYADHLNQLAIIKNLHQRWGSRTSIGLEMVQQPYQAYLDNYIAGKINEAQMLRGVQWYQRWVYDFRLYRPIFSYAKANKIPLRALNIPRELTQRITQVSIKGLNKTERDYLPAMIDRSNANYRKRITSVFGQHSHTSSKSAQKFLDAQLAWDEGMAYAAAKHLLQHPNHRMVVLAGGGHIINREGIPDRLDRQIKSHSAVVLNNINSAPTASQGDYLLFTRERKLPQAGLIGIAMKDSDNGLLVAKVLKGGAAWKAGLRKGDVIVLIDGQKINNSSDIKIWALDKAPGTHAKITLKRYKSTLQKSLILTGKMPKKTLKHRF